MVFGFIKDTLQKIYATVTSPIKALFARPIDEQALADLEVILLSADTGIKTTRLIMEKVKNAWQAGSLKEGTDLKALLEKELVALLQSRSFTQLHPIILLVGINGSGKTTSAAKLAYALRQQNKKLLLVAADTFRAAATQQLEQWAAQLNVPIVTGTHAQDPASVVFAGMQEFKNGSYDAVIIDTAGRLQTKLNLMKELEKIKRVIGAQAPGQKITTLLTIDSMLGQNSFEQANLFNESTPIDGIILTKMDGTAKGGIVFSISHELNIPIAYISFGEKPENLKKFDVQEYVKGLLND